MNCVRPKDDSYKKCNDTASKFTSNKGTHKPKKTQKTNNTNEAANDNSSSV